MKSFFQSLFAHYGLALTRTRQGHMAELLRRRRIDHVIDIGANIGQFAGEVRRSGYVGRLTCFEPNPEAAKQIPATLNADVRQVLLSDETTASGVLKVYDHSDFSSIYTLRADYATRYAINDKRVRMVQVPAVRLDDESLLGDHIYLKIDTQGSEKKILEGGGRLLRRTSIVQAEIPFLALYAGAPTASELLAVLAEAGFHLARIFPITYVGECIVDADAFFERLPSQYAK